MHSTCLLAFRSVLTLSFAGALLAVSGPALADAGHAHGGASIGEPAKALGNSRTVRMTLGDTLYEPRTVKVKAGETVRFVLVNTGELLHEFNIGTAAMHAQHRKEMQAMLDAGLLTATGMNHDMTNMDHSKMRRSDSGKQMPMKHDDPNSVLVGPGETKELVWKFPKAAELQFACNIPGHYEAGMVGEFEFGR